MVSVSQCTLIGITGTATPVGTSSRKRYIETGVRYTEACIPIKFRYIKTRVSVYWYRFAVIPIRYIRNLRLDVPV